MWDMSLQAAFCGSPPSRAAWIEIVAMGKPLSSTRVAAFTGGVD